MKSEKRLIDANELIDSLKEWLSASNVVCDWDVYHTIEDCICEVNAQPTVDAVEVVHGRWIPYTHGSGIHCSVCGSKRRYKDRHDPWCPHCGAKMDGDKNETA